MAEATDLAAFARFQATFEAEAATREGIRTVSRELEGHARAIAMVLATAHIKGADSTSRCGCSAVLCPPSRWGHRAALRPKALGPEGPQRLTLRRLLYLWARGRELGPASDAAICREVRSRFVGARAALDQIKALVAPERYYKCVLRPGQLPSPLARCMACNLQGAGGRGGADGWRLQIQRPVAQRRPAIVFLCGVHRLPGNAAMHHAGRDGGDAWK